MSTLLVNGRLNYTELNGVPSTCSMIMYGVFTGLSLSLRQAYTEGTGADRWTRAKAMVATCDAKSPGLQAPSKGMLATICRPEWKPTKNMTPVDPLP